MKLSYSTTLMQRFLYAVIAALIPLIGIRSVAHASTQLSGSDGCLVAFPAQSTPAQSTATYYLPLIESIPPSPSIETDPPPYNESENDKRVNGTLPFGDQLGDVGQYYSQVSPSFLSSLQIQNWSTITQVVDITLYGDSGYVARQFQGCQLSPQEHYSWSVQEKQMVVARGLNAVPIDTICEDNGVVIRNGETVEPVLHGIYHAEISANTPDVISALMIHRAMGSEQLISSYPLRPIAKTSNAIHVPAVLLDRNSQHWWDTELVVQNQGNESIQLTFQICSDNGSCFNNNSATLRAKERRSFLASHLFYSDDNRVGNATKGLTQRDGWFSITAMATADKNAQSPPQIALTSHIFKQSIPEGSSRPKAENGSNCLLTSSHTSGQKQIVFSAALNEFSLLRVYNPTADQINVALSLARADGTIIDSTQHVFAAQASNSWNADALAQLFDEQQIAQSAQLILEADDEIAAFLWRDGTVVHANRPELIENPAQGTAQWAVPFWGAPVLPFRWDKSENYIGRTNNSGQMLSRFGLGETNPKHAQRPEWARKLNWYNWFALRESCNAPVGEADDYSTYLALWKGLNRCSNGSDRSCINSEERLQAIQNRIPSSCAGHPLFLSNEPDVNAGDFMSYPELSRLIYIFRDWPGDLYGPTFAGPQYDKAWYPSEATEWCRTAVDVGICPETSGCDACIQDGVNDGTWDPYDIHMQGLEAYFRRSGLWMAGRSWPLETVLDGLPLHFYTDYESLANDDHWRAPLLQQYRDRADEAGWPIIVKEYGFITWPFRDGTFLEISRCNITNRLDNARRVLQQNLGNYSAEHNENPFKLFWFHSGCGNPALAFYDKLCLFESPAKLSTPVGLRWYEDAIAQSDEDTQGICSEIRLPIIDLPQP